MKRGRRWCVAMLAAGSLSGCARKPSTPRGAQPIADAPPSQLVMAIDRAHVAEVFARMDAAGVDASRPLLWGYYFIDRDPHKLQAASPLLEAQGYRVVEVYPAAVESGTPQYYFLHVERAERHTIDSLDARNRQLQRFAVEHGLESYDGMDVGRVDGKPIKSGG